MMTRIGKLMVLTCVFVLVGALTALAAEEPIKIGIVSPVSGNYGDHGKLERMGMKAALEEFGSKVLGRPVELVVADSETNPDVAARRARRLIEVDGCKYLMGAVSSSVAAAISAVATENKVLYFATNGNSDSLNASKANTYMFHVAPSMAMLVRGGADYVAKNIGKKWFYITHDYSWGHSGTAWARASAKNLGVTEVGEIKVPLGTRDFSSQLLQARQSGADVLVVTMAGFDNVALLKQLAEYRIYDKMKVWYTLMEFVDMWPLKPEQRQAYANVEVYWNENDKTRAFAEMLQKTNPDAPCPMPLDNGTYEGWLAMKILLTGIQKAGTDDVDSVIKAIEGLEIKDNMRKYPTRVRAWDHQVLTQIDLIKANPKATGPAMWDVIDEVDAATVARTKAENPINVSISK
ncbi:MAG: ABC transporter substrate-binding protein [Pseudodesulfovibrio sp.]|uniref:ABC transporter substrate-binding protein n=1 Tax=Pseudodesulfovibrio sp. TaxID=2035812 RepID=UPI003D109CC7